MPIAKPKVHSIRGGTSFWVTAGRAGVRSSVLTVPVTFPPEEVPDGELLSGLPLPDIRGTMGTFYYFATDISRYEEGNTEMGGILKRLVVENDVARTELIGPPNPLVRQEIEADSGGKDRRSPIRSSRARRAAGARGRQAADDDPLEPQAQTAAVDLAGESITLSRAVEPVGRPGFPHQLPGAGARDGAAAAHERRQRAAALRLAGQLEA